MNKLILSMMAVLALTGCSSLGEVFVSGTNAAYALDQSGGRVDTMILKADLSADEAATVIESRGTIKSLRDKFDRVSPENLITLHIDYYQAKDAYLDLYTIVNDHKSEYTEDEWQAFTDAHVIATELDDAVSNYILSQDISNSSSTLIEYLAAIGKLAVVLK